MYKRKKKPRDRSHCDLNVLRGGIGVENEYGVRVSLYMSVGTYPQIRGWRFFSAATAGQQTYVRGACCAGLEKRRNLWCCSWPCLGTTTNNNDYNKLL